MLEKAIVMCVPETGNQQNMGGEEVKQMQEFFFVI